MLVEEDSVHAKRQLLQCLNEAYERALRLGEGSECGETPDDPEDIRYLMRRADDYLGACKVNRNR